MPAGWHSACQTRLETSGSTGTTSRRPFQPTARRPPAATAAPTAAHNEEGGDEAGALAQAGALRENAMLTMLNDLVDGNGIGEAGAQALASVLASGSTTGRTRNPHHPTIPLPRSYKSHGPGPRVCPKAPTHGKPTDGLDDGTLAAQYGDVLVIFRLVIHQFRSCYTTYCFILNEISQIGAYRNRPPKENTRPREYVRALCVYRWILRVYVFLYFLLFLVSSSVLKPPPVTTPP